MIKLSNSSVLKLLPENLKNDPDIISASKAVDFPFLETVNTSKKLIILSNLEEQPDEVLDHLLWQSHITYEEGLGLAETREEKINLIKNADYIHSIKGTPTAIEYVLELLSMQAKLKEWFEYGGDAYYFIIDIQVTTRGLSEKNIRLLEVLIDAYKNNRSWVEVINLYLASTTNQYLASSMYFGEDTTLYPWGVTEIETKGSYTLGSASQSVETLIIYPQ